MTINDILTEVDELKPNQYDDDLKITWLSNLEWKIYNDIILTHERLSTEEEIDFDGYTESDIDTDVIVPDGYCDLYKYYLFAQIDFYNNETDRYTNSMLFFNAAYETFAGYYNRYHKPYTLPLKLF